MTAYYMGVPSPTAIVACLSTVLALNVIAVLLRFGARVKSRQPIQADDWLTIPSLVLVTGLATVLFYGINIKALGYPIDSMKNPRRGIPTRKLEYASLTMAPVALALVKCSVLCFYRRIFVVDKYDRFEKRNLFFTFAIGIIILWGAAVFFVTLFACKLSWGALWGDIKPTPGLCVEGFELGWAFAVSDFITDALVLMIPVPFIWKLHLRPGKKIAVMGIFALGALATIASFLRLLWKQWSKKVGRDPSLDEALMVTWGCFWFAAEASIGLLAACLPTFGVFFKGMQLPSSVRRFLGSFFTKSSSKITEQSEKLDSDRPLTQRKDSSFNKLMEVDSREV